MWAVLGGRTICKDKEEEEEETKKEEGVGHIWDSTGGCQTAINIIV